MQLFLEIMFFVLGTCCGSFVNMWVYRTAVNFELIKSKKKKLNLSGRSFCDHCGKQLLWHENIPVVSWVWQRGKTKCCQYPLPWEYPVVELATGILFWWTTRSMLANMEIGLATIVTLTILTIVVYETVFDLKFMILPQGPIYFLIGLSILELITSNDWQGKFLSGLVAGLFVWGLSQIKIRGNQAMGDGDASLAVFMGLWLGFPNILVAFYAAFIIGAVVGVGLIAIKRRKRNEPMPFGPFLVTGTLLAYWWGAQLVKPFI